MESLCVSTLMDPSQNIDSIKHIFSGIMKQIQEELSDLNASLPPGLPSENARVQSGLKISASVSSLGSMKSTDLLMKNENDDLKKTIGLILNKFNGRKDQKESVRYLNKSLSDAICKHLQVKCQPEIQKLNEFTSSQAENFLSYSIVGSSDLKKASSVLKGASSDLQGASSPSSNSILKQLVTFGKKVKNFTSHDGQPAINATYKKLDVQPVKSTAGLAVSKLTGKELPKDLSKLFQKVTNGSSNSPGSADLISLSSFQNIIVEKVVSNMVAKMLMEWFGFPKSAFKDEIRSDRESQRSLSPPLKLVQDLIVEKITESLFPSPDEPGTAEALGAAGVSACKTPSRKPTGE